MSEGNRPYRYGRRYRPRKEGQGPTPLGQALGQVLGPLGGSVNMKLARLWRNWPEVMGEEMAKAARPLGHKRRKLIIGGDDPALLQELTYHSFQILENVNRFLGEEYFDKIQCELIQGRAPLDLEVPRTPKVREYRVEIPNDLGKLEKIFQDESAIGQCYRAYVRAGKVPADGRNK